MTSPSKIKYRGHLYIKAEAACPKCKSAMQYDDSSDAYTCKCGYKAPNGPAKTAMRTAESDGDLVSARDVNIGRFPRMTRRDIVYKNAALVCPYCQDEIHEKGLSSLDAGVDPEMTLHYHNNERTGCDKSKLFRWFEHTPEELRELQNFKKQYGLDSISSQPVDPDGVSSVRASVKKPTRKRPF